MKIVQIPTLLELLMRGARDQPISLTTKELALRLGKSQQAISKHLIELESDGLLERIGSRSGMRIQLTDKGIGSLSSFHLMMKNAMEGVPRSVELRGNVFSGLGEGAYYVSMKGYTQQFRKKIGFDPYPGTLNVKLSSVADRKVRSELGRFGGIFIEGFEDQQRTFGWVKMQKCVVNNKVEGAVFSGLERTHYDDSVLEVLAPINIRERLGLSDGSEVKVEIFFTRLHKEGQNT
ncbi:MAG: riboflavin kinase [Thaumarchaeota archaeon]|nr:riboflavin kinase [Nitrososphaerota archaeon]